MNPFHHAVLDDQGLHAIEVLQGQRRWVQRALPPCRHAGELLAVAPSRGVARLWLVPGSRLSQELAMSEARARAFVEEARSAGWNLWVTEDYDFVSGWPEAGGTQVQLGLPERSHRWTAFQGCADAPTLYGAIQYLEDVLEVPIAWGPGHVGLELIKQVNRGARRAPYLRLSTSDLGLFVRYAREYHHTDLLWARPIEEAERRCTWLHRYDKNSAYVGAASSVNLGAGEYIYQGKPAFDPTLPGLWHIVLGGESAFNGRDLPHPTGGRQDSWQQTAIVQVTQELGYQVTVLEAVTFPEYHQTLRPWYESINSARTRLRTPGTFRHAQAQAVAAEALKNIYTNSLGKLAEAARADKGDPLYRPDWWFAVVSLTKARMFWKMQDLVSAGYRPVAVHTDALYFVSQEADPALAVPGLLTEAQGIGKFKHVDSFPLADVGMEYFTARIASLEQRLRALGAQEVSVDG